MKMTRQYYVASISDTLGLRHYLGFQIDETENMTCVFNGISSMNYCPRITRCERAGQTESQMYDFIIEKNRRFNGMTPLKSALKNKHRKYKK